MSNKELKSLSLQHKQITNPSLTTNCGNKKIFTTFLRCEERAKIGEVFLEMVVFFKCIKQYVSI